MTITRLAAATFVSCFAACVAVLTGSADAQCAQWPWGEIYPVTGPSNATAALMWDPDGGGPLPAVLTVGAGYGVFTWDGLAWRELGDPVAETDLEGVSCLTVHNGTLIAGGSFVDDNKRRVAWWTGNGWASLGEGLGGGPGSGPGGIGNGLDIVNALISFEGNLVAVGAFDTSGTTALNNAALWNGTNWQPMGMGVGLYSVGTTALSIAAYDADGPGPLFARLYAGTSNSTMWLWDDAQWINLNSNILATRVRALSLHQDNLYAAGEPIPQVSDPIPDYTRVWRRSPPDWLTAAPGSLDLSNPDLSPRVSALHSFANTLFVGGRFGTANGFPSVNIARIVGSSYLPIDGGPISTAADLSEVRAFTSDASRLFAVGTFNRLGDGRSVQGVAAWDGVSWSRIGPPSTVYAIAPFGSKMAIGGAFQDIDSNIQTGFANPTINLAVWDGLNITRLGTSLNGTVRALRSLPAAPTITSLAVAGDFTNAGGTAVNRVARWNQSDTNPLQTGWSAMGNGLNNSVLSLESGYQGVLVAAGAFNASGAVPLGFMARYTDANGWQKFATAGGTDMNATVRAVKVYSVSPTNPLANVVTVAGGDFTTANGGTARRIAQWIDNPQFGSTPWAAMGAGFNNSVHAIERHNVSGLGNNIYAAGAFTADGNNAVAFNRIARWTGSTWMVVGNGIGFNGTVYALRSIGGFLYAAGDFTSVDGVSVNRVARWNGTAWSSLDGGPSGECHVLASFNGEVLVGGRSIPLTPPYDSPALARYNPSGLPAIMTQPLPQTVNCGDDVGISFIVAEGYYALVTRQWRKNNVPLTDGLTPGGSTIYNSNSTDLTIANVGPDDAGLYDCVISNGCGSVTTSAMTLTVNDNCSCVGDINLNGLVNVQDLLAVIGAWGWCANPKDCPADIAPAPSGDDLVNVQDLLAVIGAWGACP